MEPGSAVVQQARQQLRVAHVQQICVLARHFGSLAVDFLQFITSKEQASKMWATPDAKGTIAGDPSEIMDLAYPATFTKVDTKREVRGDPAVRIRNAAHV